MNAIITGGAGFLGGALAERLAADRQRVTILDDLSAGKRPASAERIRFVQGDVRDTSLLWNILPDTDTVFHLAARVSVPESVLFPIEYNAVNTGGTVSLMSAARDAGIRRVVFASSGAIYGQPERLPIRESDPAMPSTPYAISKLSAEHYVHAIGRQYRIETVILRIFNAYGPGQRLTPAHPPVVPHFLRQVNSGGSIVLHGADPGTQTRDFIYIDDVVEAMISAGRVGGVSGLTLNIGSGEETAINTLVKAVETATGRPARTIISPEESGGIQRMAADIHAASQHLDWRPAVKLEEGLTQMLNTD